MNVVETPVARRSDAPPSELIPTRRSLLERLRDLGNHDSWEEFFKLYRKLIYSTAIRAGLNESEAEEVVQETMVGVAQTMESYQYEPEKCSFKGWLMHVARRRVIDRLRRRRVQSQLFEPLLWGPDDFTEEIVDAKAESAFAALWEEEWKLKLLGAADERVRRGVEPWQYVIYHLHHVKQLSVGDVCKLLNISALRVHVVCHRVARKIQLEVKRLQREAL